MISLLLVAVLAGTPTREYLTYPTQGEALAAVKVINAFYGYPNEHAETYCYPDSLQDGTWGVPYSGAVQTVIDKQNPPELEGITVEAKTPIAGGIKTAAVEAALNAAAEGE